MAMTTNTMFGQLVIGPPGSGKTTYCSSMQQFLKSLGRNVAIINIDPANDRLPYESCADISELITLQDVMESHKLGPNGGLVFCMEFLEANISWFASKIKGLEDNPYILIDCPGQVELYTHNNSVKNIIDGIRKELDLRLCATHLVDSHYCNDPGKFISVMLTSLCTMLQIELPHINVLSKADLIEKQGKLQYNLDYYTEVLDLGFLLDQLDDDPFLKKYKTLNAGLTSVIEDYSLISFIPLNVEDKESMFQVMKSVDKANGYVFGKGEERNIQNLLSTAMGADFEYTKTGAIREKYTKTDCDMEL